jgi:hypothetical protein
MLAQVCLSDVVARLDVLCCTHAIYGLED